MIHADIIDGSALAFRLEGNRLVSGLLFADGKTQWFEGCELFDFHAGVAVIHDLSRDMFGAVNRKGGFVLEPRYDGMTNFSEGKAFVVDGTTALVDGAGTTLKKYSTVFLADDFHEGMAVLSDPHSELMHDRGLYGLVDGTGEFVIPMQFVRSGSEEWYHVNDKRFSDGLLRVLEQGRCFYINRQKEVVIPPLYLDGTCFTQGLAAVRRGKHWGYIDRQGKEALPFVWDDAQAFSEGLAAVSKEGKWGAIDAKGRMIIPCDFLELSPFRNGHASARNDVGCGLIDRFGNFIVPPMYDLVYHFHEGIARVYHEGIAGVIDRSLTVLWDERGSADGVRGWEKLRDAD